MKYRNRGCKNSATQASQWLSINIVIYRSDWLVNDQSDQTKSGSLLEHVQILVSALIGSGGRCVALTGHFRAPTKRHSAKNAFALQMEYNGCTCLLMRAKNGS